MEASQKVLWALWSSISICGVSVLNCQDKKGPFVYPKKQTSSGLFSCSSICYIFLILFSTHIIQRRDTYRFLKNGLVCAGLSSSEFPGSRACLAIVLSESNAPWFDGKDELLMLVCCH